MKKQLLLLATIMLSINCFSQINFEKGYYIDNSNQKIICLIKNIDWKNNPTEFEYKLTEDGETQNATIKLVKEFGVDNVCKYIRSTVNMDRSSDVIKYLTYDRNPIFKEEELFLRVLLEGKSNLYEYAGSNLRRFFYNIEGSKIAQLIFKKYKISEYNVVKNNSFRNQLWNDLKCSKFEISKIENLDYKRSDLVSFFEEYNSCNNHDYVNFEKKMERDYFNLTIRPSLNNSSLTLKSSLLTNTSSNFENKNGFGLGIEAEFILPFNRSKWTIPIEVTYQSFKSEKSFNSTNVVGGAFIVNVDYSAIEIPVSLRHYFFLNDKSKIFINASYKFVFTSNAPVEITRVDGSNFDTLEVDARNSTAIGIGFKQSDLFSLELRYHSPSEILYTQKFWNAEYKTVSFIFGITLF